MKDLLEFGKVLNKTEQKIILGGTYFTYYDPNCEGAHDGNGYLGCNCGNGIACTTNIWTGSGWVPRSGTCQGGSCTP